MSTVTVILRTDHINKEGLAPINFCVIKDRKYKKIPTHVKVDPKFWDAEKRKIKRGYPNWQRLNSFIETRKLELEASVIDGEATTKSLTVNDLKKIIDGPQRTDFFKFADEACEAYLRRGQIGTHALRVSIINKLKKFVHDQPLYLQDITVEFLIRYEKYCQVDLNNKVNTIHKDMKFIRKLFNDAYRLDLIEHKDIPFNKFQLKTEKTQRVYLTEEELKQFENTKLTPGTRIDLHKDMFVFAAYAGGLRVSDVLRLTWNNYDGTTIYLSIRKTKDQLSLLLPDKSKQIIEKYRTPESDPNDFIFPMLKSDFDINDPVQLDLEISRATAYINKNLNIIAKKAKLSKHISFHISRHTFATRALTKGISIDKVSKILGHSGIAVTQVYAKIVNEELNKAMKVFND